MSEVKRYAIGSAFLMDGADVDELVHESEHGSFIYFSDYDTLRAEVERLREYKESMAAAIEEDKPEWKRLHEIEVAARDILAELDSQGYSGYYMRRLTEACGRKG